MTVHYLEHLFAPRSVAVKEASERSGSLGRIAFDNLRSGGYTGALFAVNPKYTSLGGVPCHRSIAELGHAVDLILVATPAAAVPGVVREAGSQGTRSAAAREGRSQLNEAEASRLLASFGIPVARTEIARSADELRDCARRIGFPVALKLLSYDIERLSSARGVCLNIRGEQDLLREYEALLERARRLRPDARIEGVIVEAMIEKRYGRRLMIGSRRSRLSAG